MPPSLQPAARHVGINRGNARLTLLTAREAELRPSSVRFNGCARRALFLAYFLWEDTRTRGDAFDRSGSSWVWDQHQFALHLSVLYKLVRSDDIVERQACSDDRS